MELWAGIKDRKPIGSDLFSKPDPWYRYFRLRFFLDFARRLGLARGPFVNPVVAILSYHKVGAPPPEGWTTWNYTPIAEFESQIDWFVNKGWTFLSASAFVEGLQNTPLLPRRGVMVTFDDAYASLESSALPALAARDVPGVVFVPTGLAGQRNTFDEGIEPAEAIADWEQLRNWQAAGCSIQSHGASHRSFEDLENDTLRQELIHSREAIEQHLGRPACLLAYPYGHPGNVAQRTAAWAKEAGYAAAFAYGGGAVDFGAPLERYHLPRLAMGPGVDPGDLLKGL